MHLLKGFFVNYAFLETFTRIWRTSFMHSIQKIPLGYASKFRTCYRPKAREFIMYCVFLNAFLSAFLHGMHKICAPKVCESLKKMLDLDAFTQWDFC